MIATKVNDDFFTIKMDGIKKGWDQYFLLRSDVHHDSFHCDRQLEKDHLDIAKEKDAYILDFGDMYDACQGQGDPRRAKEELRPEYKTSKYLDEIINDNVEWLKPYADNFLFMSEGNHETKIEKFCETNLTNRTIAQLEHHKTNGSILKGNYSGFIKFQFLRNKAGGTSKMLRFHHGFGGNAPRSKGVLKVDTEVAKYPDVDIHVNGHIHRCWHMPKPRERVSRKGTVYRDEVNYFQLGSYHMHNQWNKEKNHDIYQPGAWLIRFYYDSRVKYRHTPTEGIRMEYKKLGE